MSDVLRPNDILGVKRGKLLLVAEELHVTTYSIEIANHGWRRVYASSDGWYVEIEEIFWKLHVSAVTKLLELP